MSGKMKERGLCSRPLQPSAFFLESADRWHAHAPGSARVSGPRRGADRRSLIARTEAPDHSKLWRKNKRSAL